MRRMEQRRILEEQGEFVGMQDMIDKLRTAFEHLGCEKCADINVDELEDEELEVTISFDNRESLKYFLDIMEVISAI